MCVPNYYFDRDGNLVTVRPGLGGNCWIVCRINPRTGGSHKVKSKNLPAFNNKADAEEALTAYALEKHWIPVPVGETIKS